MFDSRDGHYDEKGTWQRTKFCFVDCGARCTCSPPGGVYQIPRPEIIAAFLRSQLKAEKPPYDDRPRHATVEISVDMAREIANLLAPQ